MPAKDPQVTCAREPRPHQRDTHDHGDGYSACDFPVPVEPTDRRVIVRVLRLVDDAPPVIVAVYRALNATQAFEWVRDRVLTDNDPSIAYSITKELNP